MTAQAECSGSHYLKGNCDTCLFLRARGYQLALCSCCNNEVSPPICSVGHEWHDRWDPDWFTIELCSEGRTLKICPRHTMAAEILISLGLTGDQVVERLKQYEDEVARRQAIADE